jgi:hypothetical protein
VEFADSAARTAAYAAAASAYAQVGRFTTAAATGSGSGGLADSLLPLSHAHRRRHYHHHNRTGADVWVLDRGFTRDALPAALKLGERDDAPPRGDKAAAAFRRLHPAMLQNVWDVQRLVTGLLQTPAFHARGSSPRPWGSGAQACACAARLRVQNPQTCAPTAEVKPPTSAAAASPAGSKPAVAKGRLAHWAKPCDYTADTSEGG